MPSQLDRRVGRIEVAGLTRVDLADALRALSGDAEARRQIQEDEGRSSLAQALADRRRRGPEAGMVAAHG
jgi:hypothetical protein